VHLLLGLFLLASTAAAIAQQMNQAADLPILPDAPSHIAQQSKQTLDVTSNSPRGTSTPTLGFTPKQYLSFGSPNSRGSGSLVFVGGNLASDVDASVGASASGVNCGRGTVDKSNGSDWINSLLAITSHKGGRYCALGEGGFWKRGTYAATRAFVAHRYDGANSFNASELLGPGMASAMPGSYYAYPNYTGERLAARYASAVGRDTLKNMFSEFWPDFASHVLRRRP
jgi:hypothetical protein